MSEYSIIDNYNYEGDYTFLDNVINETLKHENVDNAIFSIVFINNEEMHKMNLEYRNIDRTTDVLSFALEDNDNIQGEVRFLGDIYISIDKMKAQAIEYGHSEKRELSFLVVHGLLHLLGYDHTRSEEEEKIQFGIQDEVLNNLGIID